MAISENIEGKLAELVKNLSKADFIYDFLLLYGTPKATITRLRQGNMELGGIDDAVIVKQKMFFKSVSEGNDLHKIIDGLKSTKSTYTHKPRFIVVTDFKELYALDTKHTDLGYLKTKFDELHINYEYFLPLAGRERYKPHQESMADVRAAEKMAKIYDEIVKNNVDLAKNDSHALNVFLTRLLFCFFAEDTGVFGGENLFTKAIFEHTAEDGSDLAPYLEKLFLALDTKDKSNFDNHIKAFPYVNGRLFAGRYAMPLFTRKLRDLILECGHELNWKEINPDIFGSMFQAVSHAEVRSSLGQHYTSVPNIMKVISPLFLDALKEEFEKASQMGAENSDKKKKESITKLQKLLNRIAEIKIFDPACGSGNFLIIAYKQLRLLEIEIIKRIQEIENGISFNYSQILLRNFYGIEIDDFACEIARLSLYLAQHQMNCKFAEELGVVQATLPLAESGQIVCGNACRLDWEKVCPKTKSAETLQAACEQAEIKNSPLKLEPVTEYSEIYILGNPPYLGSRNQTKEHKEDISFVFKGFKNYKNLDYIACWIFIAQKYIKTFPIQCAFVSTNSVTQGEQVSLLWKPVFLNGLEISFAHLSFKWTNNARNNAGVTCVVIGLRNKSNSNKYILDNNQKKQVRNINGYLLDADNIYISRYSESISGFPEMTYGSEPRENGNLMLSVIEKNDIISSYPEAKQFIKKATGSNEFINNIDRFCLWINSSQIDFAMTIPPIKKRIEATKRYRLTSARSSTVEYAEKPHQFTSITYKNAPSIIIPIISSERRIILPIGFVSSEYVILNSAQAIYDAQLWVFGVVTSRMHMVWVRAVAVRLETRLRYSAELCYNTFPFPDITEAQKKDLERHAKYVLAARENHSELTMAELYDPDKMPADLRLAHESLDIAIEQCYRKRQFESDEKRLEYLFKMYEMMTSGKKESMQQELELL